MEVVLNWLLSNLGWEGLKKLLPGSAAAEIKMLKQALKDAQRRNQDLDADRALMERLLEQRNVLGAKLIEANRRIAELEAAPPPPKTRRRRT